MNKRNIISLLFLLALLHGCMAPGVMGDVDVLIDYPSKTDLGGLLSGSTYTVVIPLENRGDEDADVLASLEVYGVEAGWCRLTEEKIRVPKGEKGYVTLLLDIPGDAGPGSYYVGVIIGSVSAGDESSIMAAVGGMKIDIYFWIEGLKAATFNVRDAEETKNFIAVIEIQNNFLHPQRIDFNWRVIPELSFEELLKGDNEFFTLDQGKGRTFVVEFNSSLLGMGNYNFEIVAESNSTVLRTSRPFIIGLLKGELISFQVIDVIQGEKTFFTLLLSNTANLPLNVTATLTIRDALNSIEDQNITSWSIEPFQNKTVQFSWDTDAPTISTLLNSMKKRQYIVELEVGYGHQSDVLIREFTVTPNWSWVSLRLGAFAVMVLSIGVITIIILRKRSSSRAREVMEAP